MMQAAVYEIRTNEYGRLCAVLLTPRGGYPGEPENPQLVYDGGEHAILYKNKETSVILDYINPAAREKLLGEPRILIAECPAPDGGDIKDYIAEVVAVKKIPDIKKNLLTPEKIKELSKGAD
ncbi:MAG: hypothetical protein LBT92_02070 [Rickettsiales bacterium]|jgi:hypothetical protein|nr:hypothetical protein [Rickettsiales bacterium]